MDIYMVQNIFIWLFKFSKKDRYKSEWALSSAICLLQGICGGRFTVWNPSSLKIPIQLKYNLVWFRDLREKLLDLREWKSRKKQDLRESPKKLDLREFSFQRLARTKKIAQLYPHSRYIVAAL